MTAVTYFCKLTKLNCVISVISGGACSGDGGGVGGGVVGGGGGGRVMVVTQWRWRWWLRWRKGRRWLRWWRILDWLLMYDQPADCVFSYCGNQCIYLSLAVA